MDSVSEIRVCVLVILIEIRVCVVVVLRKHQQIEISDLRRIKRRRRRYETWNRERNTIS